MSDLLIEKKHMDMMKYAVNKINQLPKKERVLADMTQKLITEVTYTGATGKEGMSVTGATINTEGELILTIDYRA